MFPYVVDGTVNSTEEPTVDLFPVYRIKRKIIPCCLSLLDLLVLTMHNRHKKGLKSSLILPTPVLKPLWPVFRLFD
ncbi:hypothetical protein ACN38_g704 [Penicillium nordicum]|uniref:Uncharacterized protein n=1 Tax=Penicillium nordicum TaxID=229535 RepID=A0A0M8PID6_9EURO|nr:hypothetical protein ACN38_g704 [Penicillium nordicum]